MILRGSSLVGQASSSVRGGGFALRSAARGWFPMLRCRETAQVWVFPRSLLVGEFEEVEIIVNRAFFFALDVDAIKDTPFEHIEILYRMNFQKPTKVLYPFGGVGSQNLEIIKFPP
eukprot:c8949_g1_i1.p1 GENE.c8949_g1_i1~~c8949_g1_i1.p1  ORF type:complete len:116 (+),score=1.10 c8949_g1_i1:729-1076(+)